MKDTNSFEDFWIAFEGVTVRDSLNTVINSVLIFIPVYLNPLSLENRKVFQKSFLWNRWFEQKKLNDWKPEFRLRESKMKLDFSRNWVFMSPGPKHNIFEFPIIQFSIMATIKTQWRLFEYSKTAETSLDRAGQFGKSSHTICMPVAFGAFRWQNRMLATKKVTSPTSVMSYICKQKRFVFEVFSFWDFWL